MEQRNTRRILKGVVVSDKMHKTVAVQVFRKVRNKKYGKSLFKRKKYFAHDEENKFKEGDEVTIMSCRPFSKVKRWRVVSV